jgi:aryl-alcohol dehydrogenase-like predicted oxidoreductase
VASPGSIEEAMAELAKLRADGKIRNIGVSNFTAKQMQRALEVAPVASLQPPYSLLARDAEESILPFALKHHVGVIVYSPMASGLLSGAMTRERIAALPNDDWRKQHPDFREPRLALVDRLREVGRRHNCTPGAVAVAWTLRNPAVTGAIVGARRPKQVDDVAAAASLHLTESDVGEIEAAAELQA